MNETVFVLKDSENRFVGSNSLTLDGQIYSYSETLINGFYTYKKEQDAEEDLNKLTMVANNIGFDVKFHIEKINIMKTIIEEKTGSCIQYVIIRNGKVQVA